MAFTINQFVFSLILLLGSSATLANYTFVYQASNLKPAPLTEQQKEQMWVTYAEENSLSYTSDWNDLSWSYESLPDLPATDFPNSSPTGDFHLNRATITSLQSFSNVTSVGGDIALYDNLSLFNFQGFDNLVSIGRTFSIRNSNFHRSWG